MSSQVRWALLVPRPGPGPLPPASSLSRPLPDRSPQPLKLLCVRGAHPTLACNPLDPLPAFPHRGLLPGLCSAIHTSVRLPVTNGTSQAFVTFKLSSHVAEAENNACRAHWTTNWMSRTSRGSLSRPSVICPGHVARKLRRTAGTSFPRTCNYHVD